MERLPVPHKELSSPVDKQQKNRGSSDDSKVIDLLHLRCRWTLIEHGSIVQTNIDHWSSKSDEDILDSIERRRLSNRTLEEMETIDEDNLWKVDPSAELMNEP